MREGVLLGEMNQNLHPVQLVGSTPKGYSKPQIIRFSNGLAYVVKFKNNPTGTRVLANEYIAGTFARHLSLPIVPFEVVTITDEFIKDHPVLATHQFASGNQFASLYLDKCRSLSKDSPLETINIRNRHHLAGVIAFDLWIGNTDRKESNILLEPLDNGEYDLYLIDHGRCFSETIWTVKTLKKMPKMAVETNVHKWWASLLQSQNELNESIERIMSLPEELIHEVIQSTPHDWDVSEREREALVTHLLKARALLPKLRVLSKKK